MPSSAGVSDRALSYAEVPTTCSCSSWVIDAWVANHTATKMAASARRAASAISVSSTMLRSFLGVNIACPLESENLCWPSASDVSGWRPSARTTRRGPPLMTTERASLGRGPPVAPSCGAGSPASPDAPSEEPARDLRPRAFELPVGAGASGGVSENVASDASEAPFDGVPVAGASEAPTPISFRNSRVSPGPALVLSAMQNSLSPGPARRPGS